MIDVGDGGPAELDDPGIRVIEPRDQPQQRGLAGPGRSEQRDDLAGADRELDVAEDDVLGPIRTGERPSDPAHGDGKRGGVGRREWHAPESTEVATAQQNCASRNETLRHIPSSTAGN